MLYSLSSVPTEKLDEIQAIEAEIGKPLLAFSPVKAEPTRLDRENSKKFKHLKKIWASFSSPSRIPRDARPAIQRFIKRGGTTGALVDP